MGIKELLTTPVFWDTFGVPVFIFIIILSGYMLLKKQLPQRKYLLILLLIGIFGLLIDGFLVKIKLLFLG